MSRDWSRAFKQASFRGVPFWVDSEGGAGGRRVSIQHVAYAESHVSEDFGSLEKDYPTQIYVASENADADILALEAAFNAPGAGLLKLPMQAETLVHVERYQFNRRRRVNGFISCGLTIVAAGGGVSFPAVFGINAGLQAVRNINNLVKGMF